MSTDTIEEILNVLSWIALVIGTIGNVTVCTVIWYTRSVYCTTNIYLLSLASADLVFLIIHLSRETYYYVTYTSNIIFESPNYGFFVLLVIFKTAKNASSFTITAFTAERYLAICRPLMIQTMPKKSRVNKVIVIIWFVAGVLSFASCIQSFILFNVPDPAWQNVIAKTGLPSEIVLTSLNFVIPMVSITVMYIFIGIELRKSTEMRKSFNRNDDYATKRALKMFVFIVVVFAVCWAPYYIGMIMKAGILTGYTIFMEHRELVFFFDTAQKFTRTVYPVLNPLIYTMMSHKFREVCKDWFSKITEKMLISRSKSVETQKNEITIETG